VRLEFPTGTTNNVAEWKSLIAALKDLMARIEKAGKSPSSYTVEAKGDSQLVINQASGNRKVKQPHLRPLKDEAVGLLARFKSFSLVWWPRSKSIELLGH
jgi:ribonuclease HI